MTFNDLLAIKGHTVYSLSKSCNVPKTTIFDISTSKTDLQECTGRTLRALAKALGTTIEKLLDLEIERISEYPLFLAKAVTKVRGSLRKEAKFTNMYISQLKVCVDAALSQKLISEEESQALKARYRVKEERQ